MDRLYQLGRGIELLTKQQIEQKLGAFGGLDYQYYQVKNLIGKI